MAHGVTTEWEDIQVKLGNYVEREKIPTGDELHKIAIETVEKYDPLEKKTLDDLNLISEIEDDEENDEVLKAYKEKRMAEMKEYAQKAKYGKVIELRKQDYIAEVNNAPKDVFVILFLYQNYVQNSNILGIILDNLAVKFPLVKFMKIVATNCVVNYKDEDVPGLIVYQNGAVVRNFMPASYFFGGNNMTWKSNLS